MAQALRVVSPGASIQLTTGGGHVVGFSFQETSGTAGATLALWDSDGAETNLLLPLALSSGQSVGDMFSHHTMPFFSGVYFQLVSGEVEGVVWVNYRNPAEPIPVPVEIAFTVPLAQAIATEIGGGQ